MSCTTIIEVYIISWYKKSKRFKIRNENVDIVIVIDIDKIENSEINVKVSI